MLGCGKRSLSYRKSPFECLSTLHLLGVLPPLTPGSAAQLPQVARGAARLEHEGGVVRVAAAAHAGAHAHVAPEHTVAGRAVVRGAGEEVAGRYRRE